MFQEGRFVARAFQAIPLRETSKQATVEQQSDNNLTFK